MSTSQLEAARNNVQSLFAMGREPSATDTALIFGIELSQAETVIAEQRPQTNLQSSMRTAANDDEADDDVPAVDPLRQFIEQIYTPDATREALAERATAEFPNESFDDIDQTVLDVIYEKVGEIELTEPKRVRQFGDPESPVLRAKSSDGFIANVDWDGTDVYTDAKYQLPPELVEKFKQIKADEKQKKVVQSIEHARYDFQSTTLIRRWDYDGLIARGVNCLWLGARKAEKSLFALRKAMHDACGKDWLGYKNLTGPVRVLYFDSENDKADVDDRYREILTEFASAEQALIQKNLVIYIGKELKRSKVDIEYDNTALWDTLKLAADNPRVVYLDCWYQLQSVKAADNETQKRVLELFESYFPKATLFLLHHTGRESQESLLRKNPSWLRNIGAERWSNKAAGGNVLTKKAELIICQEKYVERDQEGVEGDWYVDFQAYSRSGPGSILFSFEPVFFGPEQADGTAPEYKYRRKFVVKLSSLAAQAARKIRDEGPWPSRYALAKSIGMNGGKQYRAIDELMVKGFIFKEGKEYHVKEDGYDEAVELSAENVIAVKNAGALLDELLFRSDGTPHDGVPLKFIEERAKAEGISMASLRKVKTRRKIQTIDKQDGPSWVANEPRSTREFEKAA